MKKLIIILLLIIGCKGTNSEARPIRIHLHNYSEFTTDDLHLLIYLTKQHYLKIGYEPRVYIEEPNKFVLPNDYYIWERRQATLDYARRFSPRKKGRVDMYVLPNLLNEKGQPMTGGIAESKCIRRDYSTTIVFVGPERWDGSEGFTFAETTITHEAGHATSALQHLDKPQYAPNLMASDALAYADKQTLEFLPVSKMQMDGCQHPGTKKRARRALLNTTTSDGPWL